jgi:AraC-like DNA-binding protein
MMIFDSSEFQPEERADAIRDQIWRTTTPVEVECRRDPGEIAFGGSITRLGRVTSAAIRCTATATQRTAKLTRDHSPPKVTLMLQVSGSSLLAQGGRDIVLRPGQLAFRETTQPYELLFGSRFNEHRSFQFARDDLALPSRVLSEATALPLRGPVVGAAAAFLGRLDAHQASPGSPGAEALGDLTAQLARAIITTQQADQPLSREPLDATLLVRVIEYIRAHLPDSDLTAARIAAAHHVSVRHLYSVLAAGGISLGDWVRARRLEECRKDLAQPAANTITVAAVGRRWGLNDATSFGRAFKDAYGMSPGEWRALHQQSPRQGPRPARAR